MSRRRDQDLGLSWRDFPAGVILAPFTIILYMILNIMQIWTPSRELDIIQTFVFLLIIFTACTVIIDYFLIYRKKR